MREYLHILFDLHRNILYTGDAGQMVGCVDEFLHVKDPKAEKNSVEWFNTKKNYRGIVEKKTKT